MQEKADPQPGEAERDGALAGRGRRLAIVGEISRKLLLQGEPRDQLKPALDVVAREIGAELFFNYLVDAADGERLHLANAAGLDRAAQARFAEIGIGDYLCGKVARDRRPILRSDIQESTDKAAEAIRWSGANAYAGYPLLADGHLLGTIAFCSRQRSAFTAVDTELIATVASLFAAAILRERLTANLHKSEGRYAAIFNSATIGLAETDLTGKFRSVNDRFCEIAGRSRDELVRLSIRDITHPEDFPRNRELIERTERTGEPFVIEKRYVRADGSLVWVRVNVSLARTPDGPVIGLAGAVIDITEERRARQALLASEARFRTMADNAPVMVWVAGPDGSCTYLSRSWYDFTGQTEEEGVGFGWLNAVHPDDRAAAEATFLSAKERQQAFRLEYRLRRKDGVYRWAIDAAAPLVDEARTFRGYIGSVIDISDRRAMEEQLRESEERYRRAAQEREAILSQLVEGVIVTDTEGRITFVNEAAAELHGTRALDVSPEGYSAAYRLLRENGQPYASTELPLARAVLDGEEMREVRWRIRRPDGGEVLAIGSARRITGRDGAPLGAVLTVRDDTARQASEDAVRASEARYRSLIEASTSIVWTTDAAGAFIAPQPSWEAYTGQPFAEHRGFGWTQMLHPEDRERIATEWARAVIEGRFYSTGGRVWHAASQTYHHFIVRAVPVRRDDGKLVEWIGTITDIQNLLQAEESLRETKQRLDAVLDNATVAILVMDERQQCVYMNAAAEQLTGYTLAETQGRPLHDVVHHTRPDGTPYPLSECPIDRAFPENNQESGEEIFVHKDGSFYPVAFTASPIRDRGRTVGTIIEVRDISSEKAAQERQRLLTHELNHRVKNTLAVMQSVASMTARYTRDPESFRQAFSQRLAAIARIHDVLTRGAWTGAKLGDVVATTLAPYEALGASRVAANGPSVTLDPSSVLAYSMALHELATNAAKYGALSVPGGQVRVDWEVVHDGGRVLEMSWCERGGPRVEPPVRTGFGSKLIQGLANQLEAQIDLEYRTEGLVCRIRAPLIEPRPAGVGS